jgi:peroxiredoxin Q/BCP
MRANQVLYSSRIPRLAHPAGKLFTSSLTLYTTLRGYFSTTQACLFRDGHSTLTSTGYTIYGLSGDSPKANTTFKTKQKLPYDLLCNPSYSLIGAIGMQDKPAKKTKRGVFAVDKSGKVVVAQRGGPQATVDAVKELVDSAVQGDVVGNGKVTEEKKVAATAGEVADAARAAKLDATPKVGTPA